MARKTWGQEGGCRGGPGGQAAALAPVERGPWGLQEAYGLEGLGGDTQNSEGSLDQQADGDRRGEGRA